MTEEPGIPPIDSFTGRWGFLSNFHRSVLVLDGILYDTAEHAFQALKTLDPEQQEHVRSASTPGEAKSRGRKVTRRPGWDDGVRFVVMRRVLRAKFDGDVRTDALLSTGRARLVEGNTWHDNTWGDCRCGRIQCSEPGENYLGRILMELRAELTGVRHLTEDARTEDDHGR